MIKEFWLNLPVKDLNKSKEFFSKLGFAFNPRHINSNDAAGLVIGNKGVLVMLFPEATFKSFTNNEIGDTNQSTQVLLSIDAESKEEVDELVLKAVNAGGVAYCKASDQGWMYAAGFADLDGHRWNVLYMDMSKMPS
jgi:predicted lactoylglutathione lyase